jgi:outer membrane protein TolC
VNNSDWPTQGDWRNSWSVRLGLSFPLFDGFAREEGVERARVQETTTSAQLADARRAARADAERLLGALRLASQRIALSEESVKAAEEDLRVQQERYQLGASTMLELLTSQEGLVQEQTDLVSARFSYQLARAELQALAGRPL